MWAGTVDRSHRTISGRKDAYMFPSEEAQASFILGSVRLN